MQSSQEASSSFLATSFFDETNKISKLWVSPGKDENKFLSKSNKPILQNYFWKKGKKTNSWKKRFYYLFNDFMYYTKDDKSTKVNRVMVFEMCRFFVLPKSDQNKEYPYGFKFIKNSHSVEIYTHDVSYFTLWKNLFSMKLVQTTFHEEYEVRKMIGKGSFAKVYLAIKKETGEQYAIKAFNKEYVLSQQLGKEGLINEISIMRKLSHKNLLKIYEVYETKHSLYLVLQILKGGELIKKIKEKAICDELDIAKIMKNFLEALKHIHENGIMHRDLKPENLLLKDENSLSEIVVADFGLSTYLNLPIKDILFKRCGTPGFVAPEILCYKDGQENFYDEKCDIFSAGVIFYLLLTGKKPFQGADYKQILRANKTCQIDFSIFSKYPEKTVDLLKKMLSALPENRLTAEKALDHPYFEILITESSNLKSEEEGYVMNPNHFGMMQNLNEYNSIHGDISKESLGSLSLVTRKPALNGKIDTIEKITNLNSGVFNVDCNTPKKITSKFGHSNQNEAFGFSDGVNGDESPSKGVVKKKNVSEDLHKKAIINNLNRNDVHGNYEEKKNNF